MDSLRRLRAREKAEATPFCLKSHPRGKSFRDEKTLCRQGVLATSGSAPLFLIWVAETRRDKNRAQVVNAEATGRCSADGVVFDLIENAIQRDRCPLVDVAEGDERRIHDDTI